ncbi:histone H1 [Leadbetterella byssophila]|uniref:histone H1 n=1 Tax=Leadbetterella byssophila TaxID=316068 RepID=UPI00399F9B69
MQNFNDLKEAVLAIEKDAIKAETGNKAAGTRVRKALFALEKGSKAYRKHLLEVSKN